MPSEISIPNGAWVVVADGRGARFFSASVSGGDVSLETVDEQSPENLLDDGPAGKRPPEQTEHQTDEATFAKQLSNTLYALAYGHRFEHLVLVADPQTLGQIRGSMHQEVRSRLVAEIDKTMTTMSVTDIESALSKT